MIITPDIEDRVLMVLVADKKFALRVLDYFTADVFTKIRNKILFSIVEEYYKIYKTSPKPEYVINIIRKSGSKIDDDDLREIAELTFLAFHMEPEDIEFIRDTITEFVKRAALRNAISDSGMMLSAGKIDQIFARFEQARKDCEISIESPDDFVATHAYRVAQRFELASASRVPTGIGELDGILGGGLMPGTLGVAMAPTNVGKTATLCNFAVSGARSGKRILYISLEDGKVQIGSRLEAICTGTPISGLPIADGDKAKEILDKISTLPGHIYIQEYPAGQVSIERINALIKLMDTHGKKPDLVVLDSADLIALPRTDEMRLALDRIYINLRGYASENRVAIWTASQANRRGMEARTVTNIHTAESIGKTFTADIVITINQTADEYPNRMRIFVAKARNARKFETVNVFFDPETNIIESGGSDRSLARANQLRPADLEELHRQLGGRDV